MEKEIHLDNVISLNNYKVFLQIKKLLEKYYIKCNYKFMNSYVELGNQLMADNITFVDFIDKAKAIK